MVQGLVNGDFENGLSGWRVIAGDAFANQPVLAETIGAADVLIAGGLPVPLGGDYWHTTAYPIGHHGRSLIRVVATKRGGVLDSNPFSISARFLAYRLGGSAGGGSAIELRIPAGQATGHWPPLDQPDAEGFVAVVVLTPGGSDLLDEGFVDLAGKGQSLVGVQGKVRLRVSAGFRPHRLLVDHVRLLEKPPPTFHRPAWGWADIHCHPMAQAGFGDLMAGHIHGPVEDVGSCLEIHGHDHGNPLHPVGMALDGGVTNDGSTAASGWSTTVDPGPEGQGFRGWPAFDEITHVKTHQDWIKRAYDGGLRLMVALVVHNKLLALISRALTDKQVQSDRDVVEPQVHMLREFVAHNQDWCGLATSPGEARRLIGQNRMAFVLGLETDSINDWVNVADLPNVEDDGNRAKVRQSIHEEIHHYFRYLRDLGVVQVNLLHLSNNAFGGMALYDVMFVYNTLYRTGAVPQVEDGHLGRPPGEAISTPVTIESELWEKVAPLAIQLGLGAPPPPGNGVYGHGDRNTIGLLPAGEEALLEAMRFGMVVDMDHMSEKATVQANTIATTQVPQPPYPLVAAHNGTRMMAMEPPPRLPAPGDVPGADERRNPHTWANENTKSETHLDYIRNTGGMFGHGIAGADSKDYPGPVPNDAPGTSKTVAQGLQYVMDRLGMPAGLGTDWNALLGGPGPRFGPMAVPGLLGELGTDDTWAAAFRGERWADAVKQSGAVVYDTPLRDWRSYRFRDSGLYADQSYGADGRFVWQALVLRAAGADLTSPAVVGAAPGPALDLALGLTGGAAVTVSVHFQAGAKVRDPNYSITGSAADVARTMNLIDGINEITAQWDRMTTPGAAPPMRRSTVGPLRDFDYNLDGLAHYGMLPDMLQDLRNVGLPPAVLTSFFASAERYLQVWERSVAVAAMIPHPPVQQP